MSTASVPHIFAAVELTLSSRPALEPACRLARTFGAELEMRTATCPVVTLRERG